MEFHPKPTALRLGQVYSQRFMAHEIYKYNLVRTYGIGTAIKIGIEFRRFSALQNHAVRENIL